jgi:hypothetical protein
MTMLREQRINDENYILSTNAQQPLICDALCANSCKTRYCPAAVGESIALVCTSVQYINDTESLRTFCASNGAMSEFRQRVTSCERRVCDSSIINVIYRLGEARF